MDSLDFYRRNRQLIMVALTLMAMITFVFDDSMRQGNTTLVPIILAMLFGGGMFVWGTRKGKQNEYGTMGAVVGAVMGLVIITFGNRTTSDQPPIAGLTSRDIANLKQRRETANRIVSVMFRRSHPMPKDLAERGAFMAQFHEMQVNQQIERVQFGFGRELDQDVVFTQLLEREAARLGITVNDDAVTDFLKMICHEQLMTENSPRQLSTETFQAVTKELRIGENYLYDVLREEIAARLAASVTVPHVLITPEQRWRDFRKVNVRHTIEATTIPVEPFVKGIADPGDEKLLAFFKTNAEKVPGAKGEPGFRQPRRARLAYLEANYETIEKTVAAPTDEEIAKHYEDNKNFYIDRTPLKEEKSDDEKKDADPDAVKPEGSDKKDDAKKPDEKDKADDKPTENKKDAPEKSDSKDSAKPDAPKGEKPAEPKESDKPKADKPADSTKPDPAKSDCEDKEPIEKPAADKSEKKEADKPEAAPKDDKKSEEKKPDEKKSDAPETPKPAKDKDEKKMTDAEKTEADKPGDEAKTAEKEKTDPAKDDAEKPTKKPEVRYKPFESVKDDIRDQLLRTRTLEEMSKRIEDAIGVMRDKGSYLIEDKKDPAYRDPESIYAEIKEFGKKHELKYVETDMVSAFELYSSTEYTIAKATDPFDPSANQRQGLTSVVDHVFARSNDGTHSPEVAEDLGTKNRFAYWVIERKEVHVPTFKDPGIREQVLKAWKLVEARPKAEARAKDLAKLAATDKKSLTEVLADQTVTGEKGGLQLTVIEPPEFSHFTQQGATAPRANTLSLDSQPVELGQITGLENVDDDTLSAIDALAMGSTETIPNADRSAFLVVQVIGRQDVSADEDAPQRKDFMGKWLDSTPARQLASNSSVPLRREWHEAIERKYGVVWPVK